MSRLLSTSLLFFLIVPIALGDEQAKTQEGSVRQAILGLNSKEAKVRAESVELLASRSDLLWDAIPWNPQDRIELLKFRTAAQPFVKQLTLALKSDDQEVVSAAASSLAMLGVEGKAAIPTLRAILKQMKHADKKSKSEVNWEIISALLHVTPKEKPIGPLLLEFVEVITIDDSFDYDKLSKSPEEEQGFYIMTGHAGIAYTYILARADRTVVEVPYLIEATSPKHPLFVRTVAIDILEHFAWDAEPAIPALQKLLRENNKFIQASAAAALVRIQKSNANITSILKELKVTREQENKFREFAKDAVKEDYGMTGSRWGDTAEWVLELIEIAKCSNGFYRRPAIIALGSIGADAKPALPALTKILKDCDKETRKRIVTAIWQIDPAQAVKLKIPVLINQPHNCR